MSNQLQKAEPQGLITAFNRPQIELIKRTVARGATDDELQLFLYTAQKHGLDPLAKQIYFQKRRNNKSGEDQITIITGIDGYRAIADRTGKYAGNDDPDFDDEHNPARASVTVYKLVGGVRCPFTATARWDQYYPGDALGFMWRKMPHLMLGKCAEALALRKAFPDDLSGIYVKEEMDQAGAPIEAEALPMDTVFAPEKTEAPKAPAPEPAKKRGYDGSPAHQEALKKTLVAKKIDEVFWADIDAKMMGRSFNELEGVLKEVMA